MSVDHESLAQRLRTAYRDGPIISMRDGLQSDDISSAYTIQSINTQHWKREGRRVIGRKIGLTSEVVQRQLGVDQPDFGTLFDDMLINDGGSLALCDLLQPKVEAEVALVIGRDIDVQKPTMVDVLMATSFVLPALEIVDSRIENWEISIADTIADNASSGRFVLGCNPRRISELDLRSCGMVMELDGHVVSTGVGAACLGHPLNAAVWLARTLAARGDPLRCGDTILTGALGPMVDIKSARRISASIGGVGGVTVKIKGAEESPQSSKRG